MSILTAAPQRDSIIFLLIMKCNHVHTWGGLGGGGWMGPTRLQACSITDAKLCSLRI